MRDDVHSLTTTPPAASPQTLVAAMHRILARLDPKIEAAFLRIPRHYFLPEQTLERVYSDQAVATKLHDGIVISSSSQPSMMAMMLGQLDLHEGDNVMEIGAGTGELSQSLHGAGLRVDGLDLWPKPDGWRETAVWHVGDLRSFDGYPAYAGIVGNLIFHQFADEDLRGLGEKLQRHARVIVACEPHRRRISQVLYRTLGPLFGANHVSLHDAHVSIAAGFRDDELPVALGLAAKFWAVRISCSTLGLYRMIAVRH